MLVFYIPLIFLPQLQCKQSTSFLHNAQFPNLYSKFDARLSTQFYSQTYCSDFFVCNRFCKRKLVLTKVKYKCMSTLHKCVSPTRHFVEFNQVWKVGQQAEVHTSVDSEYLLTRVLTREYLFFDTFWDSSLLELDFSFLKILERVEY